MKRYLNRHSVIAAFFLCFIFMILGGTLIKVFVSRNEYKLLYIEHLGTRTSANSKTKAFTKTAYDAMNDIDNKLYKRTIFINVYGLVQKAMGNRYVYDASSSSNDIFKLSNGSLTFVLAKENDLARKANNISYFNEYLKSQGIELLYVQLPFKLSQQSNLLPLGVVDHSNGNSDVMIAQLKNFGVATYDLRSEILENQLNHYSLFFSTDHHWKPETALWVSSAISEKLNNDYGFHIELSQLEKSKFDIEVYSNWFLGSQGKRVGQFYAGTDNFSLILPKYKTDLICSYYRNANDVIIRKGCFENTWIFKENLEKRDYFNKNTYMTYSGKDCSIITCTNNLIAGKKILLLRDSFTGVLAPFFSLVACNELHTIDPRYFEGSIKKHIDDFKPDIVLMLYYPTALSNADFFMFD